MPGRKIIVIGGSTGALEAVRPVLAALPYDLDASIFVTLHTSPSTPGVLDRILSRAGPLPAVYPRHGDAIVPRRIYVAPPDRHLLVKPGHVLVTAGPRENRFRPAIDPLFRTAAAAYRQRVIGIILSGGQDDGAVGLAEIKRLGGVAIVQEPGDALIPSMPQAAMRSTPVDHAVPADQIAALIAGLVRSPLDVSGEDRVEPDRLPDVAEAGSHDIHRAARLGPPSPFTCPDCGGTLWESERSRVVQFQCHVGHRYSGDTLADAQSDALDHALWTALRSLEESAELRRRMAGHARDRGMTAIAESYLTHAAESEQRASVIRRVLMRGGPETAAADTVRGMATVAADQVTNDDAGPADER